MRPPSEGLCPQAAADLLLLVLRFLFLHGGVPTGDRMPMIDKFQTDPNVYVFRTCCLSVDGRSGWRADSVLAPASHLDPCRRRVRLRDL